MGGCVGGDEPWLRVGVVFSGLAIDFLSESVEASRWHVLSDLVGSPAEWMTCYTVFARCDC